MNDQLTDYFLTILNKLSCAFRKNKYSCQSLQVKMVDKWKMHWITIYHRCCLYGSIEGLVAKCHAYGVTVPPCELLADYLSQRKQRVKIGSARSSWTDLHIEVRQGSILGPLLFNIFINDFFLFIEKCSLYNYADDNTISYSSPCLSDVLSNLQSGCNHVIEWFNYNGMKANPDKFQFMVLSSSSLAPELLLDPCTNITEQDFVKVLGITIGKQLTFNEHISLCCTKAAFARISKYLNPNSRRAIHHRFIGSTFSYCPLVWHFCGKTNNAKLEKIQ